MKKKKKTAYISYNTSELNKRWQKRLQNVYDEIPDITTNTFKYIYAGSDDFWFDLNDKWDPTEDWDNAIDGISPPPPPPKNIEEREKLAHNMLKTLSKKERKIVKEHLFRNKSFAQIGREMGYTRQNIKYHYDKSIKKLQEKYNDK